MTHFDSIAFPIHQYGLPKAKLQTTGNADRPFCSNIAAYAAMTGGAELRGSLSGASKPEIDLWVSDIPVPIARLGEWASAINGERLNEVEFKNKYMGFTPSEYQKLAVRGLTCAGGVLALFCGAGKTLTAVMAALAYLDKGSASSSRCWIVCPLNAIPAWKKWEAYLGMHFTEVRIMSMDSAHKVADALPDTGGVVIYDEVHLLGTAHARRTTACHTLRRKFDAGLCLTGTLLHGGIEKALSILDLAVPGAALFSSKWKCGDYFHCLVKKQLGRRTVTELEKPVAEHREAFMRWISRVTVSLTPDSPEVKSEFTLPEQHIHAVNIGEPWASLEDEIADTALRILADTGELPAAPAVAHLLCRTGIETKLAWLHENMGEEPCVVFAFYHESLDAAAEYFDANGISYVRVDGGVVGKARMDLMERFQSGAVQVFLGQMDAACTSMDLFRAFVSVALDHTWKPTNYSQALARTCRRGQEYECHHFDLIANRLQNTVVKRLLAGEEMSLSLAEWQDAYRNASTLQETV